MLESGYEIFYFTYTNMDSLAIGSLLALEERNLKTEKKENFYLVFSAVGFLCLLTSWVFLGSKQLMIVQIFKPIAVSIFYYGIIGYFVFGSGSNIADKVVKIKPLLYTGKISYGLYVYHPFIFRSADDI